MALGGLALKKLRDINGAYVRCLGSTTGTVFRETIRNFDRGPDKIAHNRRLEAIVDELHAAVDGTAVVVLNEANDVNDRAVELLTDIRGVSVCLICHEPARWYSTADPHVRNRLRTGTELSLDR